MTFVRTKLLLESMRPGQIAVIRLKAGEALINVPRSAEELGHVVHAVRPEIDSQPEGVHRLWIEKR